MGDRPDAGERLRLLEERVAQLERGRDVLAGYRPDSFALLFLLGAFVRVVAERQDKPDMMMAQILGRWHEYRSQMLDGGVDPSLVDDIEVTVERAITQNMADPPLPWFPNRRPA